MKWSKGRGANDIKWRSGEWPFRLWKGYGRIFSALEGFPLAPKTPRSILIARHFLDKSASLMAEPLSGLVHPPSLLSVTLPIQLRPRDAVCISQQNVCYPPPSPPAAVPCLSRCWRLAPLVGGNKCISKVRSDANHPSAGDKGNSLKSKTATETETGISIAPVHESTSHPRLCDPAK